MGQNPTRSARSSPSVTEVGGKAPLQQGLGFTANRCMVIGANGEARRAFDLIHRQPHAGLQVAGMVHCGMEQEIVGTLLENYPLLGTDVSLKRIVRGSERGRRGVMNPTSGP